MQSILDGNDKSNGTKIIVAVETLRAVSGGHKRRFTVKLIGFGRGKGGEESGTGRKVWIGRMAEK